MQTNSFQFDLAAPNLGAMRFPFVAFEKKLYCTSQVEAQINRWYEYWITDEWMPESSAAASLGMSAQQNSHSSSERVDRKWFLLGLHFMESLKKMSYLVIEIFENWKNRQSG